MNYREMAVEVTKIAGHELMERADELIPRTEGVRDIDIWIKIPSMSDDPSIIPEIQVNTNVYPRRKTIENVMKMRLDGVEEGQK